MKTVDQSNLTKALAILSTAGALLVTPGFASQESALGASGACADEKCCALAGAGCMLGEEMFADHYYEPDQPCMS